MGLFSRNKIKKIKREEVVDAICELNKRIDADLSTLDERKNEMDFLFEKGKASKDRDYQLFCAKRINMLKAENRSTFKNIEYMHANVSVLSKLKTALDEKEFILANSNQSLKQVIENPKELASFLAKISTDKSLQEEKLTTCLEVFKDAEEGELDNEELYGEKAEDSDILAMFELSSIDELDTITKKEQERKRSIEEE